MDNASQSTPNDALALAPSGSSTRRPSRSTLLALLALFVAILSCLLWWHNQNRLESAERELARRIQSADTMGTESHVLAKEAQDQIMALQGRLGVLESKFADSQSQQASLEQLYQD